MSALLMPGAKVMPLRTPARTLVEFHDVDKSFVVDGRTHPAVTGVTLEVRTGEVLTLVGPSGCGKSTLLNMTAGMFVPTGGRVLYRGEEVRGLNHRVGYMTQQDYLLPWRSVLANIALPLEIKGLAKVQREERTRELVRLVGLEGFERYYPSQISGGMKKRCALARLLAQDPETLLMDEPFGALDAQMRLGLQAELLRISRRLGKTVMFVTHDLDEAIALADRCVVFRGRPGRILDVIDVDLGAERDLTTLRFDARYVQHTQQLWRLMAPELTAQPRETVQ
ncbi:MAG TPA: ABC transporter ATP-binding protein [Ramlibacter sp.]|nr:ABC transporter ATP-binding protein [Ramlibacter sp.]